MHEKKYILRHTNYNEILTTFMLQNKLIIEQFLIY